MAILQARRTVVNRRPGRGTTFQPQLVAMKGGAL
jgi:hypothetical protein